MCSTLANLKRFVGDSLEKFDYRRPMLFWQGFNLKYEARTISGRLRIIYPDGSAVFNGSDPIGAPWASGIWNTSCWATDNLRNAEEAVAAMRRFDDDHDYPPAEFIGYI